MRRFGYNRVSSLEEALELKARWGKDGLPLAGGTDLLVALRLQSASLPPLELIDIGRLPELGGVALGESGVPRYTGAQRRGPEHGKAKATSKQQPPKTGANAGPSIRVGALVTHAEAAERSDLQRVAPLLSEACAQIGSPQIRGRGTIGGNVCNASPCADTLPPLVALGARLVLLSKRGRREVGVDEAVAAPYETVLEEDEILSEIHIPQMTPGAGSKFIKLGRRNALSISRMSFAAIVGRGDDGRMREVRIAAGSVAPTTRRFVEIEEMLTGRMPGSDLFAAAGRELAALMVRLVGRRWSTPYKEPVVAALARRALAGAAGWKE